MPGGKRKKNKNDKKCNEKQKHFSLFIFSVDGVLDKYSQVLFKQFSQLIAKKLEQQVPHVHTTIKGKIVIAVAQSYLRMLCVDRLPGTLQERDPNW